MSNPLKATTFASTPTRLAVVTHYQQTLLILPDGGWLKGNAEAHLVARGHLKVERPHLERPDLYPGTCKDWAKWVGSSQGAISKSRGHDWNRLTCA